VFRSPITPERQGAGTVSRGWISTASQRHATGTVAVPASTDRGN
jgi:hypothetical protein